jgi:hypothetical protein
MEAVVCSETSINIYQITGTMPQKTTNKKASTVRSPKLIADCSVMRTDIVSFTMTVDKLMYNLIKKSFQICPTCHIFFGYDLIPVSEGGH